MIDPDVIKLNIYAEDIFLDISTSIPCSLIINELVSNAFKHAFPDGREGEISVTFTKDKADNRHTLIVSDNGISFPDGLDFRETETLGMQLVNILTEQLHGAIEIDRRRNITKLYFCKYTLTGTLYSDKSPPIYFAV